MKSPLSAEWPPAYCPHCRWHVKLSTPHKHHCPSLKPDKPSSHQVAPNLFVGSVEARASSRFVAVVSILSSSDTKWVGSRVGLPKGPCHFIDHEDRIPGLLAKCVPAWEFIDAHIQQGPVLVHCLQGASRSVSVAGGWRLTRERVPVRQLVPELVLCRPSAMFLSSVYVRELEELQAATGIAD